jgi:hypothetical protein
MVSKTEFIRKTEWYIKLEDNKDILSSKFPPKVHIFYKQIKKNDEGKKETKLSGGYVLNSRKYKGATYVKLGNFPDSDYRLVMIEKGADTNKKVKYYTWDLKLTKDTRIYVRRTHDQLYGIINRLKASVISLKQELDHSNITELI